MKFLNFGSLNLDYTYKVNHIVMPGETISSTSMSVYPGGKGLNQSVALARAGGNVYHAGMIGDDGKLLLETCFENGINTDFVKKVGMASGNAMIQVADSGENCIVLYGGANQENTIEHIEHVLSHFQKGDVLLLQNEINLIDMLIEKAYEKEMFIALNPSPYNEKLELCDFHKVDIFLINEVEGLQMTGEKNSEKIIEAISERYPKAAFVLTLGSKGAMFGKDGQVISQECYKVNAVDTTAAGDTFTGYFLKNYFDNQEDVKSALEIASKAAALAVTRQGAVPSIPWHDEIKEV